MVVLKLVRDAVRGLGIPPVVVGVARGAVEAGVMAALIAIAEAAGGADWGDRAYLLPLVLVAVRTAEGWADHIDPARKRAP